MSRNSFCSNTPSYFLKVKSNSINLIKLEGERQPTLKSLGYLKKKKKTNLNNMSLAYIFSNSSIS